MKLLKSTREYLQHESASGVVMIFFAILAILFANSQFSATYNNFIDYPLPAFSGLLLKNFVKDVLMVFFFFLVGLELKREGCEGFLKNKSQIFLPLIAAIFGMVVPAAIFYIFNHQTPDLLHGWAIPSATDIAFAVCILLLVTKNFPNSAKIFLLAIAIFDDLGAILIIAFFYSAGVNLLYLGVCAALVLVLFLLNKFTVRVFAFYLITGGLLAYFLHAAGVHTTIAGVITALAVPYKHDAKGNSMLKKLIHKIHLPISFFVLPLFAFVSAGVSFAGLDATKLFSSVPAGIALGLFIGKQIGIFGSSFICIKLGLAKMPEGSNWLDIYIVSVLAGVGFTMSLFVGQLAYSGAELQEQVKIGVLAGSIASSLFALILAKISTRD